MLLPDIAPDGEADSEISDTDKLNGLMFNCHLLCVAGSEWV